MESRSWYEQEKALGKIAKGSKLFEAISAPDRGTDDRRHAVVNTYQGNRHERRTQAAIDRKNSKEKSGV